jgi:hypothetical protein
LFRANSFETQGALTNLLQVDDTLYLILEDGDAISVTVIRDGKELVLKGKINLPKEEKSGFMATDKTKETIKNAWLKG